MKNKLFAVLLTFMMVLLILPTAVAAADDYVINTVDDLLDFAEAVNGGNTFEGKTIKLGTDLDLDDINWTPIGNDKNYFQGTFDGQNHTISNMTIDIDSNGTVFAGLFGGIKKATVKNLKMDNVNIDVVGSKVRAAAVAGIAHSNSEYRTDAKINFENITVEGCTINAEATSSTALLGGVIGYSYPANMKDITVNDLTINGKAANSEVRAAAINGYVCGQNISSNGNTRAAFTVDTFNVSNVTIAAEAYTVFAGGYAPYTYYGYITLKNGTIDGIKIDVDAHEAFVGGLVGYFWRSDAGHTVKDVNITGIDFDVTTDYLGETRVGGMVGTSQSPNTTYTDCSVAGEINEQCSTGVVNHHAKAGGFVARTYEYARQTYTNCVADVDVTGSNVAGGFVGNHTSHVEYVNCEAKGDVSAHISGGFVGRLTNSSYTTAVDFSDCKASGDVNGTVVAGGFIGSTVSYGWGGWGNESTKDPYRHNVTLKNCVVAGDVTGNGLVEEIIGEEIVRDGVEITLDNVRYDPETPASFSWFFFMMMKRTFDIEAIASEGGAITPEGVSAVQFLHDITYTITADEGYELTDVLVDGESVGAVSEYTFDKVSKAHTIEAVFTAVAAEEEVAEESEETEEIVETEDEE